MNKILIAVITSSLLFATFASAEKVESGEQKVKVTVKTEDGSVYVRHIVLTKEGE